MHVFTTCFLHKIIWVSPPIFLTSLRQWCCSRVLSTCCYVFVCGVYGVFLPSSFISLSIACNCIAHSVEFGQLEFFAQKPTESSLNDFIRLIRQPLSLLSHVNIVSSGFLIVFRFPFTPPPSTSFCRTTSLLMPFYPCP